VGEDVADCRQLFGGALDVFRSRFLQVDIVLGEGSCSGCMAELVSALSYVAKAGFHEQMNVLTVVVRKLLVVDSCDRAVAVGDCAQGMPDGAVHVPCCPPSDRDIIHGLCEACSVGEGLVLTTMEQTREKLWADSAAVLQH
jgi:Ni,Fe-hydrogenase III small subunit